MTADGLHGILHILLSDLFLRSTRLARRTLAAVSGDGTVRAAAVRFLSRPECRVVAAGLTVRVLAYTVAVMGTILFPLYRPQQFSVLPTPNPLWDVFARFDSGWYFGVARHGYEFVEGGRSNLAFFPAYPMLMRYGALALGGGRTNVYLAGVIVSWTAFCVASVLLYRLARQYVSDSQAVRASLLLMMFPFGFFYGVVYTEAVFLLCSVGAFLGFRQGRWFLGGLAGAALTATRVNGIVAWPALALVAFERVRHKPEERTAAVVGVFLVPMGLAAYSAFAYSLTGSPLEWMHSIERWDYHPGGYPWTPFVNLFLPLAKAPYAFLLQNPTARYDLLNGLAALFALLLLPRVVRTLGWGYALLILGNLWLPLSSGVFEGLGRYVAVLFPLFVALSTVESSIVRHVIYVSFGVLFALCSILFTNLHPIF